MNGGKLSLTKFLDDKASIFASLSKGYKQGGFNTGLGLDGEEIISNMMSGDYENLLQVFDENFGSFVILER